MGNLMKELRKSSDDFGRSITGAFAKGVADGRKFEDVLKNIGKAMVENLLKAALKPVELSLSSSLNEALKPIFSTLQPFPVIQQSQPEFAHGAAFSGGRVRPFAAGGVIAAPTFFPMAGGSLGLMGERGSEAIMPLSRGADGKLGVRAEGGGQRAAPIIVQVTTPDADSFRRSESQISAAIARAAARGRRAL
jgi:phage-related minor tail protein